MANPGGLLHNRHYVFYRTSRVTSLFGSRVSAIAYPLLILGIGGTAVQAGAVASCQMITALALKLPAGHLADRVERRSLMISMDLIRMISVGSVPVAALLHGLAYPQLIAVAIIEGAGSAVFGPAAIVSLREVVPKEQLNKALSQTQATSGAMSLIGPTVGGVLYGVDRLLPFTVDAGSYLVSAALLLGVCASRPHPADAAGDQRITAGARWLWHQRKLMRVLLFTSVMNLLSATLTVVVIISLREHGASSSSIGILLACVGCGAIAGSFLAPRIVTVLGPAWLCLANGALWVAGLSVFAAAFSVFVVGPVLAMMFVLAPAAGIMLSRTTLDAAPPHLLGRVSTAEQMVSLSLAGLGPVLGAALLEGVGRTTMWLVLAAICLTATLVAIVPLLRPVRPTAGGPLPDQVSAQAERG